MIPVTKRVRKIAQGIHVEPQLLADCLHDCPQNAVAQQVAHKQGASAERALLNLLKTAHPAPAEGLGLTTKTRKPQ